MEVQFILKDHCNLMVMHNKYMKEHQKKYLKLLNYLGNGYYAVRYPDDTTQEAHESTLDFDGAIEISFPTWGKAWKFFFKKVKKVLYIWEKIVYNIIIRLKREYILWKHLSHSF